MRAFAVLALGLLGCGDPDDGALDLPICRPGSAPELAIGEGRGRYESRADEETIGLVHGPQGGFHIEVGLRATHLDASEFLPSEMLVFIDGEQRARARPWLDFTCTERGLESFGTLLIFEDARPEELDGRVVDIDASVTDVSGLTLRASKTLVITDLGA